VFLCFSGVSVQQNLRNSMPVEDLTVSFDNGICDKPKNMIDVRACYKPTEKVSRNRKEKYCTLDLSLYFWLKLVRSQVVFLDGWICSYFRNYPALCCSC
jgi:hypothetical protein